MNNDLLYKMVARLNFRKINSLWFCFKNEYSLSAGQAFCAIKTLSLNRDNLTKSMDGVLTPTSISNNFFQERALDFKS